MKYILEASGESARLEKQNSQTQYCIRSELKYLELNFTNKKILDAGCGVGSLAEILHQDYQCQVHGCDASAERIKEAEKKSKDIHYFVSDITTLDIPDNHYDIIITRFVIEHTPTPEKILKELYRVLRPGGSLVIIDLDGLIFNLYHQNQELNHYLEKLKKELPIDLFVGRKLPKMMSETGLSLSECHVQSMVFLNHDLRAEFINMEQRFIQSKRIICEIIGEQNFDSFLTTYLDEFKKTEVYFCNKFIVTGVKHEAL